MSIGIFPNGFWDNDTRERAKLAASQAAHDPAVSVQERAFAVLTWARAHYWRAREALEVAPRAVRRQVHGSRYYPGYELEFDVYVEHWLAAVAPRLNIPPAVLAVLSEIYGYNPCPHRCLPPGRSMYVNPNTLPAAERWPEPEDPGPRPGSRKRLRIGDCIRLKVPTMGGYRGLATVTDAELEASGIWS
jgi:hypothetical protein